MNEEDGDNPNYGDIRATGVGIALAISALAMVSCSGGKAPPDSPASPDAAVSSATPERGSSSAASSLVDRVALAMGAADVPGLVDLIAYEPHGCTQELEPGGLRCPNGVPHGAALNAVPVGRCQSSWMLDTSSREAKEMLVAGILTSGDAPPSGFELHAVARGNAPDEAKLVVIGRARDNPRRGLLISLSEKGIVGFSTGCGNPPEDLAAGFTSFEIAPPASR